MFPLRDDIPSRRFPIINYLMIGLCVAVFLAQMQDTDALVDDYGMVPALVSHLGKKVEVTRPQAVRTPRGVVIREVTEPLPQPAVHPILTLVTCTFLHGGLLHLLGNVWFLYVFGDNVEDRLGPFGYLCFYLAGGTAASLTHFLFQTDSPIPTIGASGAVAAVMGAYMWLYPHARVLTIIPIFFILQTVVVPAPIFLGIWFVIQLVQGTFSIGSVEAAGVAWWAHAGGFAFGFAVAKLIGSSSRSSGPRVRVVRPRD